MPLNFSLDLHWSPNKPRTSKCLGSSHKDKPDCGVTASRCDDPELCQSNTILTVGGMALTGHHPYLLTIVS